MCQVVWLVLNSPLITESFMCLSIVVHLFKSVATCCIGSTTLLLDIFIRPKVIVSLKRSYLVLSILRALPFLVALSFVFLFSAFLARFWCLFSCLVNPLVWTTLLRNVSFCFSSVFSPSLSDLLLVNVSCWVVFWCCSLSLFMVCSSFLLCFGSCIHFWWSVCVWVLFFVLLVCVVLVVVWYYLLSVSATSIISSSSLSVLFASSISSSDESESSDSSPSYFDSFCWGWVCFLCCSSPVILRLHCSSVVVDWVMVFSLSGFSFVCLLYIFLLVCWDGGWVMMLSVIGCLFHWLCFDRCWVCRCWQ
jgi:hypothetical protein